MKTVITAKIILEVEGKQIFKGGGFYPELPDIIQKLESHGFEVASNHNDNEFKPVLTEKES